MRAEERRRAVVICGLLGLLSRQMLRIQSCRTREHSKLGLSVGWRFQSATYCRDYESVAVAMAAATGGGGGLGGGNDGGGLGGGAEREEAAAAADSAAAEEG